MKIWTAGAAVALMIATPHLVGPAAATPDSENGRIAMLSFAGGNADVWDMAPDGTDRRQLTTDPAFDVDPAWSPDGSKIAFASDRDGDFEVFVMNADGSGVVQLTDNSVWDRDPAWSPDGTQLAYASTESGLRKIHVMGADGTGHRLLTPAVRGEGWEREPSWSTHGIVYQTIEGNAHYDIHVVQPDGSGETNVTSHIKGDAYQPRWHPTDPVLVFSLTFQGPDRDIALLDLRGGPERRLTSGRLSEETPTFSPDGQKVLFWQHAAFGAGGKSGDHQQDIWVVGVDGTGLANLTQDAPADASPSWQRAPRPTVGSSPSPSPTPLLPEVVPTLQP